MITEITLALHFLGLAFITVFILFAVYLCVLLLNLILNTFF